MKRTARAIVASIILVCGLLTGCVSNDPFDSSMVINFASLYGVMELADSVNVNTAIKIFSNKHEASAAYRSKDKAEAESLYKNYLNKNNWYPAVTGLNAMTLIVAKDMINTVLYESTLSVMYFDEQSDAKAYFDAYAAALKDDREIKKGFKGDYEYAISFKPTASRTGNCDFKAGAYLKGNSVLLCSGISPIGGPDSFSDVIYDKIGLLDPITLKKK
jgi:hypothetical protein